MATLAQLHALMVRDMSEDLLQRQVLAVAKSFGWLTYHTYDSRRSQPGFPDLALVHPRHGLMFRELKKEKGRVTPDQRKWLGALKNAGCDVGVWRPSDYVTGVVTRELNGGTPLPTYLTPGTTPTKETR